MTVPWYRVLSWLECCNYSLGRYYMRLFKVSDSQHNSTHTPQMERIALSPSSWKLTVEPSSLLRLQAVDVRFACKTAQGRWFNHAASAPANLDAIGTKWKRSPFKRLMDRKGRKFISAHAFPDQQNLITGLRAVLQLKSLSSISSRCEAINFSSSRGFKWNRKRGRCWSMGKVFFFSLSADWFKVIAELL